MNIYLFHYSGAERGCSYYREFEAKNIDEARQLFERFAKSLQTEYCLLGVYRQVS